MWSLERAEATSPYVKSSDGSIIVIMHSMGELKVEGLGSVTEEGYAQDAMHGIG